MSKGQPRLRLDGEVAEAIERISNTYNIPTSLASRYLFEKQIRDFDFDEGPKLDALLHEIIVHAKLRQLERQAQRLGRLARGIARSEKWIAYNSDYQRSPFWTKYLEIQKEIQALVGPLAPLPTPVHVHRYDLFVPMKGPACSCGELEVEV